MTIFGDIFQRKKRLLKRLNGIAHAMADAPNEYLCGLENTLLQEYTLVLEQEEQYWRQKSRIQWFKHGDKNSKFFHLPTMTRRCRNKVEGLFDADGCWRTDESVTRY